MKTIFNINTWERKLHFEFFNQFDDPSFEITANVDCSKALQFSKGKGYSFFLYYLHCSLKAVNAVNEFKIRIEEEYVYLFDKIHAGPTIARENGTFGFSHLPYIEDFKEFAESSESIIQKVKFAKDLNPSFNRSDVVHYSSIPWISFTSVAHPKFSYQIKDSIPKISFGKIFENNGKKLMPISVTANHALMDGLHIGRHLELFQEFLDNQ